MVHEQVAIHAIDLTGSRLPTRMECRALVEQILQNHLHTDKKPRLVFDDYGKPSLEGYGEIAFSYAHSRTQLVVAMSPTAEPIGTDTEPIDRTSDLLEIKAEAFSSAEIHSLTDGELMLAWCRKEAAVKRLGKGFRDANPSQFTVAISSKSYKLYVDSVETQRGYFLNVVLDDDVIVVCTSKLVESFLLYRHALKDMQAKE